MDEEELTEKSGYKLTYVGLPGPNGPPPNTQKKEEETPPPAGAEAAPGLTAASPAGDAVGSVAEALQVAPAFVAPGKAIIDNLIAKASDNSISVDELTSAAEDLLKTVPELDATADLDSVIDALTTAVQRAAEATLAGA
jgi:type III secretion system FlhB-like substrate exporter